MSMQTVHHVRRETATPVSTLVLCGDPERVRKTVGPMAMGDAEVMMLTTAAQIREYADRHSPPDSCVIVTPLPDGPTLPLVRMLRSRGWSRVMVLSGKADPRAVHGALVSGVRSVVVNRENDPEHQRAAARTGSVQLSDRELEVLRMVADGQTNRAVGEHLGLSALTVKSHLARIARKLGCGDRAQMVAEAIRSGYIA